MKLKKFLIHNWEVITLVILLLAAFVLRSHRLTTDLLFHRDQGLHSLSIWQIWHERKISLLGHPSDVTGLIHSPVYYFLMAPAYAFFKGSPVAASLFQVSIEVLSLPFFYLAIKKLFNRKVALSTLLIYAVSYGWISYSRWLVNVTPIIPLTHLLLFFIVNDKTSKQKTWRLFAISLLVGIITQLNAAVGTFLLPLIIWLYRKPFSLKKLAIILIGFFLPALPLLVFELRHNFVLFQSFIRFSKSSDQGLGFSLSTLWGNLRVYLKELQHVFSFPLGVISTGFFVLGLFKINKNKHSGLIYSFLLIPFLSLLIFQRGAISFFYISLLPLSTAVIIYGLFQLKDKIAWLILSLVVALNIYHLPRIYQPTNALIPIGSNNLITIQDRKNIIDWVYKTADGQQFSLWYYTIPYYQEEVWDYMFLYYAQPKYGYLPEKTSGFSPNELDSSVYFYAIYEPDEDKPNRLKQWLEKTTANFGPVLDTLQSNDLYVHQHLVNQQP